MASVAWIVFFGVILIINSATSDLQSIQSNRKCRCGFIENICRSNLAFIQEFYNPYSQPYCAANEVMYCSIPDGSISETCGMKKIAVMSQKKAGETQVGEYAWQAAILKRKQDGSYVYIGSGVLINKKHVLTVVQNVETFSIAELSVRLGDWDLSPIPEECSHQDYQITKIIKHPGFNTNTMENNIAMLILDKNVPLAASAHINTACLSSGTPSFGRCWVAGWGGSQDLTPGNIKRLRDVSVPIVNRYICQQSIHSIMGGIYELPGSIICAGDGFMNSCTIDGGAPLICESTSGQMEVVGLVSANSGCQQNVPSLYTDVSKYVSWIHKQVFEYY